MKSILVSSICLVSFMTILRVQGRRSPPLSCRALGMLKTDLMFTAKANVWESKRDSVRQVTDKMVMVQQINNPDTATQGYIGVHHEKKQIIVGFRGSHSDKNWEHNMKFIQSRTRWAGVEVHSGFKASYIAVAKKVQRSLRKLVRAYHGYHILFTGHSLGAAITSLAALDFAYFVSRYPHAYRIRNPRYLLRRVRIILAGSPRIGNGGFNKIMKRFYGRRVLRVVHGGDRVVHLPPRAAVSNGFGRLLQIFTSAVNIDYEHIGKEIWIRKSSPVVSCLSGFRRRFFTEDPQCSISIGMSRGNWGDHDFATYLDTLEDSLKYCS